jgi:hypothetical protein
MAFYLGTHRNLIVKEFDVFDGLVKNRCGISLEYDHSHDMIR